MTTTVDMVRINRAATGCRYIPAALEHNDLGKEATMSRQNLFVPIQLVNIAPTPGRPPSWVTYFIQGIDGGPIKIGKTKNLAERMWTMQTHHPVELICIGMLGGDREKEMHSKFAAFRRGRTEWFEPQPELIDFIWDETVTARKIAEKIG
jgi:hypothetical protein